MITVNTMVEVLRGELIYRRGAPIEACHGAARRLGWRRAWLRAYALNTEQVQRILGDILRGGKIVIATGHSRTVDDDETEGKVEVRPDINPALSNGVFGLFSIIAYCYPTREGSKMLTKPEDNEKRRILAGDRSGVLPKIMRLSADELMAALKATQPQGSANGGAKASAQQSPAKASAAKVEQIKAAAIALYGEEWPARVAKLAEDASGGGASTVEELTPKEAEALMGILESAQADK